MLGAILGGLFIGILVSITLTLNLGSLS